MAVKSNFASGDVLTASDVNTYLTNGGLVYISAASVGSGVSSVTVSNVFSSTYDNYRIIYKGDTTAVGECLRIRLGSTATGYYGNMIYANYSSGTPASVGDNNATYFTHCSGGNNGSTTLCVDLFNPYLSSITSLTASHYMDANNGGSKRGILNDITSYTGFTLYTATGTISNGTVRVYGYRQA